MGFDKTEVPMTVEKGMGQKDLSLGSEIMWNLALDLFPGVDIFIYFST